MAEKKRKSRGESKVSDDKLTKKHKQSKSKARRVKNEDGERRKKRTGPRLPNAFRKEIDRLNSNGISDGDEEVDSDEGVDVYEYEEEVAQEETGRNRRFDAVENFEYELPEQFKDENVYSDDDDDDDIREDDERGDEVEEEDDGRHGRMLQGITGMPSDAFEGKKKKSNFVISEAYPESEYNPSRDILDGESRISVKDLLDPLQGKLGNSRLRKRMHQMEKKAIAIQAPLRKADQDKLERKAVYEQSKKDITKWEALVKRNREAPTVYFDEDINLGFSTVGAIASEFEPRTDFEKKIASIVYDEEVMDAHRKDGSRLLELNKVSVADEKNRHDLLAKTRNLLFRHEMKAKHIKNIKSKTYHRLLKKDRLKAASAEIQMDPKAAKELVMKQEFKRAEERMTLKHKNSSKWAKRILQRGLAVQDEGTRAAISEQLHHHALLTRKMNSMKDSSTSGDNSSDEDENSSGSDHDEPMKLLEKAKEKTLKVLEDDDDEIPKSGVLSLPFMVRGMKKRKEVATEEARLALQEYESSLSQLDGKSSAKDPQIGTSSGRRVFGAAKKPVLEPSDRVKSDNFYDNSDSEDDLEANGSIGVGNQKTYELPKYDNSDSVLFNEDPKSHQESLFKSFADVKDPGPKTTYEVSIFASDSWRKMKKKNEPETNIKKSPRVVEPAVQIPDSVEVGADSDTDSEGQMVDGILSAGAKTSYELPSHEELRDIAFAGDDVEDEFEKDKNEVLNEENPEPEKPMLVPGWGQWTHVQKKKGLPSWMREEHENAKRKREAAVKNRKDAHLKHVIISEKLDKKAEKLHTKTLPYPFTSKELFEQSIRMPIGPEFNPATVVGALNRPEVVKKSGVIIKPIKFQEVNPHEKGAEHMRSEQNPKMNKGKGNGGKTAKNKKSKKGNV